MDHVITNDNMDTDAVASREWLKAFLVAAGTTALVTVPYILGYTLAKPGTVFSGVIMNPEDTQSYFAKMLQGYEGGWLYSIPFTTEMHQPAFVGVFYLVLGHLARWLGLTVEGIWHLSRIVADIFLFMVTFGFIATFLSDRKTRWIAYLMAVFGSGLGWALFLIQQPYWLGAFPVDFKMPEAHLFFTSLTYPHVAVGTGLLLVSFWFVFQMGANASRSWLYSVLAGLANLSIAIVYPFLIYLVVLVTALYWLLLTFRAKEINWLLVFRYVISLAIPLPLFLYYAYTNQANDVFRSWSEQASTASPPWPHYLIAYGTLLILALLPVIRRKMSAEYKEGMAILWVWVFAATVLAYSPANAQRRFIQGVHVPLSILAAVGLVQVFIPLLVGSRLYRRILTYRRYTDDGMRRLLITSIILFFSLSNLYVLADVSVTAALRQPYPFFRQESELATIEWLRENEKPDQSILAAYETGNYVAAKSGNRVFIGHWAETVNWQEKSELVGQFYDETTSDTWRRELLEHYGISYVWHGPIERDLGQYNPEESSFLQPVFDQSGTTLYKVEGAGDA